MGIHRGSQCWVHPEGIVGIETEPLERDQHAQTNWEMDLEHPRVRASSVCVGNGTEWSHSKERCQVPSQRIYHKMTDLKLSGRQCHPSSIQTEKPVLSGGYGCPNNDEAGDGKT